MSLKSQIWVQAFMRRLNVEGKSATLLARGAAEAGAIFVVINALDGRFRLLGPAPGPAYDSEGERRFIDELPFPAEETAISALLQRRQKFDSDIWIVEAEARDTLAGLKPIAL